MKFITKIEKNDVWVSDENNDPVPGIEFYISTIRNRETWDDSMVYIYYNCIDGTWFGTSVDEILESKDLNEETLNWYIDKFNLRAQIFDK